MISCFEIVPKTHQAWEYCILSDFIAYFVDGDWVKLNTEQRTRSIPWRLMPWHIQYFRYLWRFATEEFYEKQIECMVYLFLQLKLDYLLINRTSPWQQMIWLLASISIMVLSIQYKQVLVFHWAGFQLPMPSQCWETIENSDIFLFYH